MTPAATAEGLYELGPLVRPPVPGVITDRPPAATPAVPEVRIEGGPPPSHPNVVDLTVVPTVEPGVVRTVVPVFEPSFQ